MAKAVTRIGEQPPAPVKRQEPGALSTVCGNVMGTWQKLTGFLTDVRAETRKVVVPSRKDVQATTTVVLFAVFAFGIFFMVTDFAFNRAISQILHRLGGAQ